MPKPFMGVDIDGTWLSSLNLSRINYANLSDEYFDKKKNKLVPKKIKLTGNTIKSKVMPEYIEEFIDNGLKLILEGDGEGFVDYYNQYIEKIYYKLIPLKKIATKLGMKIDPKWITGKLAEEIFEHVAQDKLIEPTFVMGYPVDTSPLVRAHRDIPGVAEKWDLYVDGFELATGYSELIDPVVQRERLLEQAALGANGDLEAMQLDEDFLRAMEFGMPPMGGMGMGVDRLLMALTGLGIRETILFPLVKPEVD
jgi:aspartyl/asparaginyl-tRNA synthetase